MPDKAGLDLMNGVQPMQGQKDKDAGVFFRGHISHCGKQVFLGEGDMLVFRRVYILPIGSLLYFAT